jgi:hypothetical protein
MKIEELHKEPWVGNFDGYIVCVDPTWVLTQPLCHLVLFSTPFEAVDVTLLNMIDAYQAMGATTVTEPKVGQEFNGDDVGCVRFDGSGVWSLTFHHAHEKIVLDGSGVRSVESLEPTPQKCFVPVSMPSGVPVAGHFERVGTRQELHFVPHPSLSSAELQQVTPLALLEQHFGPSQSLGFDRHSFPEHQFTVQLVETSIRVTAPTSDLRRRIFSILYPILSTEPHQPKLP